MFIRQVKSAILGATMTNRLQQKQRNQNTTNNSGRSTANNNNNNNNNASSNSNTAVTNTTNTNNNAVVTTNNNTNNSAINVATTPQSPAAADSTQTSKYNTNRNLSASNAAKCCCYGNPQVCNICLIKKEIHASRAGTPGYRPPEVLLKYPDQTTAVDIWAAGVILLSILSSVYPFFKAPNDYVALAEMVTIFGDKTIRKTAFILDRLVTLSQKTKPLDLRKLCVRFRNRAKFSSPELLKKYQRTDGTCEVCKNCDQFYFNCLCAETQYTTEPLGADDPFPASAYDLLYKLLEVNPHKRITAEEALKHPFFSEQLDSVGVVVATHKKQN